MTLVLIFVGSFQERRGIILGEGLIEVHMTIWFLLWRTTYLLMCGDSVHRIKMGCVS
jgi:hypothetical protein